MSGDKLTHILKLYAQMPIEDVLRLEAKLPKNEKILTKKIPIPKLVFNKEKLLRVRNDGEV